MKKFLSSSLVLVIGTILAAGLNYGYNLLVNRLLVPADYATFSALLGLVMLIGAPVGALQVVAAKYSADYMAEGDVGSVWRLLRGLTARVLPVGIFLFGACLVFAGPIASLVANDSTSGTVKGVVVIGAGLLFQLLLPLNRGILQGTQSFLDLAINLIIDAFGRIAIGLAIMLPLASAETHRGFSAILRGDLKVQGEWVVAAAIGATVLGTLVAYFVSYRPVGRWASHKPQHSDLASKEILRFAAPAFFMNLFTTALLTIDVILVKRYADWGTGLTPDNAGEYATLSTLAKLIFYITGPIVTVMFPMISDLIKKNERHFPVLLTATVAVLTGSVLVMGVFAVAPNFIISHLAPNYSQVADLLVPMTVIFLVYGLTNLFSNYFLSLKRYMFLLPLALGGVAEIVLISLFHDNINTVIKMVTISQGVALAGLLTYYLFLKRMRINEVLQSVITRRYGQ